MAGAAGDWTKAFEQLVAATTAKEMEDILDQYMTRNPLDDMALRLAVCEEGSTPFPREEM